MWSFAVKNESLNVTKRSKKSRAVGNDKDVLEFSEPLYLKSNLVLVNGFYVNHAK